MCVIPLAGSNTTFDGVLIFAIASTISSAAQTKTQERSTSPSFTATRFTTARNSTRMSYKSSCLDPQGSRRPRLLIVAALFAPSKLIGARRPERMAVHLSALGWEVTVLTLHPRHMGPVDPSMPDPGNIEIVRTSVFRPGDLLRRAVALAARLSGRRRDSASSGEPGGAPAGAEAAAKPAPPTGVFGRLERGFWRWLARRELPDPLWAWRATGRRALRGRRFDVVLATLPPYTPALLAMDLARASGAKLVLDYRDPWTEAPRVDWGKGWYEPLRDRHRRLEDTCLRAADLVLGASPTICRWLAPRTQAAVTLLMNSYEPAGARTRATGDGRGGTHEGSPPDAGASSVPPARLVYAGSLAYGRTLDPVLEAMAHLSSELGPDRLRLDLAGSASAPVQAAARRFGVSSSVRDLGSLTPAEARALLIGALGGIVLVSPRYEYNLPAKLFDAPAAGCPVLLIAPEASDAAALVRRHGLGWVHEPDDVAGIVGSLREALAGRIPHPEALEELQTAPLMARLDRALRELLEKDDTRKSPD